MHRDNQKTLAQGNKRSRRSFLRTTAATGAAATFASTFTVMAQEAKGANERIGVGFIGVGGTGRPPFVEPERRSRPGRQPLHDNRRKGIQKRHFESTIDKN